VGANHGEFCLPIARANPDIQVIAFEPIPELLKEISQASKLMGIDNLILRPEAIVEREGKKLLNVSTGGDMGTSSLLGFDSKNISSDSYWRTRSDLVFSSTISVPGARLDSIIQTLDLGEILFLKTDTQGLDLGVMRSLGKYRTRGGMLESPTSSKTALYVGEPELLSTLRFLEDESYTIWEIKPNDPACSEVNVFFCDGDNVLKDLEDLLSLNSSAIYSSKKYWAGNGQNYEQALSSVKHAYQDPMELENQSLRENQRTMELENQSLRENQRTMELENQSLRENQRTMELENQSLRENQRTMDLENQSLRENQRTMELENQKQAAQRESIKWVIIHMAKLILRRTRLLVEGKKNSPSIS
jgi:FkbM family methyltransferase